MSISSANFIERQFCPVCKSKKNKTIYSCGFLEQPVKEYLESFYSSQGGIEFDYLQGGEFILQECGDCGLIFQKQVLSDLLMRKLYEEWIDFKIDLASFRSLDGGIYASVIFSEIKMLIDYFKEPPGNLSFFDFGMGWGKWPEIASLLGCNSFGLELSRQKIEYAGNFKVTVISEEEIPNHRFDFINLHETLEHLERPLEVLEYLAPSLKSGGLIKLCVPDGFDIKKRLKILDWKAEKGTRNSLNPVAPLEHINCFRRDNLIKIARLAGLVPVKIPLFIQYTYAINLKSIKQSIRNLIAPIKRNLLNQGTTIYFAKS
jgi:SAM-dependent methyltransferase